MSNLIFVASQPRSGSTLLQAVISNSPRIATVSEPWILLPFLSWQKPDISRGVYNTRWALNALNEFKEKLADFDLDRELAQFLRKVYGALGNDQTSYVLDKTPRYYEILDLIPRFFPEAKIIILKRSPFSVLRSIIDTWKVKGLTKLLNYQRDLLYAPFLIQGFLSQNGQNANVRTVFYETLVADPEREIRALFDWLDLEFDPGVLDYGSNSKFVGSMGDPIGVHTFDSIRQTRDMSSPTEGLSDLWKSFFSGYANYLGSDFLQTYGGYSYERFARSRVFDDYVFMAEEGVVMKELSAKKLYSYFLLKMRGRRKGVRDFYFR